MNHRKRRLFALLVFVLLPLAGCGDEPADHDGPEVHQYTTRGIVVSLPRPEHPGSELQIRHEAIPEFRDASGEVVGMESMTMPFPAEDALLEDMAAGDIAAGDKVEFDFEVNWTGSPPLQVTRITKLPPETRLGFESEEPPERTDPDAPPDDAGT